MLKKIFAISKYDIEKDSEMQLKDKIAKITNNIDFKIKKLQTATDQKIEALRNSKTTKLDRLNRKLTRIRMTKFNEAKYIYEDSCLADVLQEEKKLQKKSLAQAIAEKKAANEQIKTKRIEKEGK